MIITVEFRHEGKRVVANCVELGTSSFGRTIEEADASIREAIDLHLNTLEETGERERFFAQHGIQFYTDYPDASSWVTVSPDIFVKRQVQPVGAAAAG